MIRGHAMKQEHCTAIAGVIRKQLATTQSQWGGTELILLANKLLDLFAQDGFTDQFDKVNFMHECFREDN